MRSGTESPVVLRPARGRLPIRTPSHSLDRVTLTVLYLIFCGAVGGAGGGVWGARARLLCAGGSPLLARRRLKVERAAPPDRSMGLTGIG